MKCKYLLAVLAPLVFVFLAACLDFTEVRVIMPICVTPVPIFQVDQASAADSVSMGCPYGFIDPTTGDTAFVWYKGP